jgi:ABC-type Fe3+ transport system substrate-binding protein
MSKRCFRCSCIGLLPCGRAGIGLLCALALTTLAGCTGGKPGIVMYSDQDKSVVEPLIKQFSAQTNLPVNVVYADAEQVNGGQGLSQQIRQESTSPQADLYWANSPPAMFELARDTLLDHYGTSLSDKIAPPFRDVEKYNWVGIGVRGRVILYNTQHIKPGHIPLSVACLAQPQWKGGVMADPRTSGSAHFHFAYLYAILGPTDMTDLLTRIRDNNVEFLPDEAAVVDAVANGKADWGVTDSDVAIAAKRAGKPVDYTFTDQHENSTADAMGKEHGEVPSFGTPLLFSPIGLIRGRPHVGEARRLYDFLCQPRTALSLLEIQPTRMPTHSDLLAGPPGERKSQHVDPTKLNTTKVDPNKIHANETKFDLMLSEVLNPH